jgi:hypothetical protein
VQELIRHFKKGGDVGSNDEVVMKYISRIKQKLKLNPVAA